MSGQLLTTHLAAEDLWSKYGFGDGNPFEFEDRGQAFDDQPPHGDWTLVRETLDGKQRHDLLELLVRRHLLPAIALATGETPDLMRIGTHHNPVRDVRHDHSSDGIVHTGLAAIAVDVTREQVLLAVSDLMRKA